MSKIRHFFFILLIVLVVLATIIQFGFIVELIGTNARIKMWLGSHAWFIEDYQNETYLKYSGGHIAKELFPTFYEVEQQKIYDFRYGEEPRCAWVPKETYQFGHLAIQYDKSAYIEEKETLLGDLDEQTEELKGDFTCYRVPSKERVEQFVCFSDEIHVVQYFFLYDYPTESISNLPPNMGDDWTNYHYKNYNPIYGN